MVTFTTLHKKPHLFHVRLHLSYLHKLVLSTLNPSTPSPRYLLYFSKKCFSAFPLFCSLLCPTYGQTLPRMNCKAMSQVSFKPSPSDSPFSDLVWFASLQRLMPWEHSACYVSKRARLKCVCPSYRLAWLFLHTPHPTHTQLMPLALGFS